VPFLSLLDSLRGTAARVVSSYAMLHMLAQRLWQGWNTMVLLRGAHICMVSAAWHVFKSAVDTQCRVTQRVNIDGRVLSVRPRIQLCGDSGVVSYTTSLFWGSNIEILRGHSQRFWISVLCEVILMH
jgi:hypothetical protein